MRTAFGLCVLVGVFVLLTGAALPCSPLMWSGLGVVGLGVVGTVLSTPEQDNNKYGGQ